MTQTTSHFFLRQWQVAGDSRRSERLKDVASVDETDARRGARSIGGKTASPSREPRSPIVHRSSKIDNGWATSKGTLCSARQEPAGLATLVDRKSRFSIIVKIQSKNAGHVLGKIKQRRKELDEERPPFDHLRQRDRIRALSSTGKHLGIKLYFADPGCPYQRGTNENTNGLIRQYFPNGTDFRTSVTSPMSRCVRLKSYSTSAPASASTSAPPMKFSSRKNLSPVAFEIEDRPPITLSVRD